MGSQRVTGGGSGGGKLAWAGATLEKDDVALFR